MVSVLFGALNETVANSEGNKEQSYNQNKQETKRKETIKENPSENILLRKTPFLGQEHEEKKENNEQQVTKDISFHTLLKLSLFLTLHLL